MTFRNRELIRFAAILCFLAGSFGCSQRPPSGSKEFLSRKGDLIPGANLPGTPAIREELPKADSQLVVIPKHSKEQMAEAKREAESHAPDALEIAHPPASTRLAAHKSPAKPTHGFELDEGTPITQRVTGSLGFDPRACGSPEFPGQHSENLRITQDQWSDANLLFSRTKKDLLSWLIENHSRFSQDSTSLMEHRLHVLRLEKPQLTSEPDLAWRGIGIATQDQNGGVIRVAPGFIELMQRQPERARFEMVRLMAQDWSPCMLARDTRDPAWEPFLACMGMEKSSDGCGKNQYSEAAWAVSSALATVISRPGCTLPAFADRGGQHCVVKYVLPPSGQTSVRGLAQAKADQESQ